VFAAGDLPAPSVTQGVVRRRLDEAAFVVAADGGLVHVAALGIEPHRIVGDLDSVPHELLASYPTHIVERHAAMKDELDLELALAAALDSGARAVSVLGAFGDRFDQSLAATLIAARLTREGVTLDLHGGGHSAWPLAQGMSLDLELPVGTTVSVISLVDEAVVSAHGLAYPLAGSPISFGSGLGVSNVVAALPAVIRCVSGVIVVVAEHQAA
jgi:thiamine pyrophosphokinase